MFSRSFSTAAGAHRFEARSGGDTSDGPSLLALMREDYETHHRSWNSPGFRALVVYRFNAYRLTIRRRWVRLPLTMLARLAFWRIRNYYGIELPPTAKIGRRVYFPHNGGIVIHRYAEIGDDCRILHGATLGAVDDVTKDNGPTLGKNVKIGSGAMVLGSVTIGDNAKVGPNAVVMSDVPAGAIAFAPVARMIYPTSRGE